MRNPNLWTDHIPLSLIDLSGTRRVLLLSDLHLGDGTRADPFGQKDQLLLDLLRREMPRAEALVIGGDIMDCYKKRAYKRISAVHAEVVQALRGYAEEGRLFGVWGNHDKAVILYDLIPHVQFAEAIRLDARTLLLHGHQCDFHFADLTPGQGPTRVMNFHGFLEATLGKPIRLPFQQHDNGLNRVVHFVFYWMMRARLYRALGQLQRGDTTAALKWLATDNFWARGQWNDLGELMFSAHLFLAGNPVGQQLDTVIMGHSHVPGRVAFGAQSLPTITLTNRFDHYLERHAKLPPFGLLKRRYDRTLARMRELEPQLPAAAPRGQYLNLGSWVHHNATYAIFEAGTLVLRDWLNADRELTDENYRLLTSADALPSTGEWYQRYTRGFARYDAAAIARDLSDGFGAPR